MMIAIQVRERAKADLPRPLIGIRAIERLLLRHATGPTPEKRLIVAVICQAMVDARSSNKDELYSGRAFLQGHDLDAWADLVDLNPAFLREVARRLHYLPHEPHAISVATRPINGRKHAGFQFCSARA